MRVDDDETVMDEPLPPALRRAARELCAEVPVSPAWRDRVLSDVARVRRRRRASRYAMPAMLAAGVLVVAGGVMTARTARESARDWAAHRERDTVRFSVVAPAARRVALVGDFNVWDPNGVAMHRSADGHTWTVELSLPPGRHAFAYMVDGRLRADPAAAKAVEDDFGSPSSVVVVASRGSE
jgi:hypothetical protein